MQQLGYLADRLSVNIELPSQEGLAALAPDKSKSAILSPMRLTPAAGPENNQRGGR